MPIVAKELSHFTPQEVKTIFNKARRVYKGPGLDILLHPIDPNAGKPFGRILVITPRKIGSAPERNRIRRRLKDIFYKQALYEKKIDCFVIIKKPGIGLSYDALLTLLLDAFASFS